MKSFNICKIFWRSALAIGCLALFVFTFALASISTTDRSITDDDVERYLPRLRAEAARMESTRQSALKISAAIQSKATEYENFYADIESGKIDVLAWIHQHTEYTLIPPGAVYNADCSRTVTGDTSIPTAIFTFGKESPYRDLLHRATEGDSGALAEYQRLRGEEETGVRNAATQAVYNLVANTVSFYKDHNFVETESMNRPVIVTWLVSPSQNVFVNIWDVNPYAGALPRNILSACSSLPTGPMVEISFKGSLEEEVPNVAEAEELIDPEYERVKEALIMASIDEADPSALTIEIPSDAPPEVKAELSALQAEYAVRLANVKLYQRHKFVLAPLIESLLRTSY